ncbi:MAG: alpha/beta hydrolase [Hyphomicrobiaceae bacterium]|nr:MAG: alpha/beta hydrolase [Hyphomicrobiaceae bacterium]
MGPHRGLYRHHGISGLLLGQRGPQWQRVLRGGLVRVGGVRQAAGRLTLVPGIVPISSRLALLLLLVLALARPASAEEVVHEHNGLDLVGNLEIAREKTLEKDGVVLLLHGTLAHHRMEIIAGLQQALKSRGLNSLAITLSLGLDRRKGMFDCALEHDHRHTDAVDEIEAWVGWLKSKGAKSITVGGHSRGGHQAALYIAEKGTDAVSRLVLVAPLTMEAAEVAAQYLKSHKTGLAPILASAKAAVDGGDGDLLLEKTAFLHCPAAKVTAAAFLDYYAPEPKHSLAEQLRSAKVPTLLVTGTQDDVVPDLAGRLRRMQLPSSVEIAVVDGADHFFRDLYLDDVAEEIKSFSQKK